MPTGSNAREFYRRTMQALNEASLPFLVGGGYALGHYTGIERDTKDFDIFVRREEYDAIMEDLSQHGYHTELTFPHWLGKASEAFGVAVKLCPVEETIWSKAYIMERERYDGADVMHLILACAEQIDWARLVTRFGAHWRVLLSHLCLFGFVYPSEHNRIPEWVMTGLIGRLDREMRTAPLREKKCQGTLLSREQYLIDIQRWGLADARRTDASTMSADDVVLWTQAIDENKQP